MKNKIGVCEDKEALKRLAKLTHFYSAEIYIEEKNYGMICKILREYRAFYHNEENAEICSVLMCPISKLKQALKILDSRTEEEELNDENERELNEIAMYG